MAYGIVANFVGGRRRLEAWEIVEANVHETERDVVFHGSCDGGCVAGGGETYREGDERGGAIHGGWEAGAADRLPALGVRLVGIWNELQPGRGGKRESSVYECVRFTRGLRLFSRARNVAGQDNVCAGDLRVE